MTMKNIARDLTTILAIFATQQDWVVNFPAALSCACCGTARVDRDTLPASLRALTQETDCLVVKPYGGSLELGVLSSTYNGNGIRVIAKL